MGGSGTIDLVEVPEMEDEEGVGEEEDRAPEVGGDEATGRMGVRKEGDGAVDGLLRGTAPPTATIEGLVVVAAAAARGEVGRAACEAEKGLVVEVLEAATAGLDAAGPPFS